MLDALLSILGILSFVAMFWVGYACGSRDKKEAKMAAPIGDPYRTPAEVPQYKDEVPQTKVNKKKRESKMSLIPDKKPMLNKHVKTFLCLMPASLTAVAIGLIWDSSFLGSGLKLGSTFALGFVGFFFIIMTINIADSKEK